MCSEFQEFILAGDIGSEISGCECVMQVGYPLVTLLLCLGDSQYFNSQFGQHLDLLYKLLRVSTSYSLCSCLESIMTSCSLKCPVCLIRMQKPTPNFTFSSHFMDLPGHSLSA